MIDSVVPVVPPRAGGPMDPWLPGAVVANSVSPTSKTAGKVTWNQAQTIEEVEMEKASQVVSAALAGVDMLELRSHIREDLQSVLQGFFEEWQIAEALRSFQARGQPSPAMAGHLNLQSRRTSRMSDSSSVQSKLESNLGLEPQHLRKFFAAAPPKTTAASRKKSVFAMPSRGNDRRKSLFSQVPAAALAPSRVGSKESAATAATARLGKGTTVESKTPSRATTPIMMMVDEEGSEEAEEAEVALDNPKQFTEPDLPDMTARASDPSSRPSAGALPRSNSKAHNFAFLKSGASQSTNRLGSVQMGDELEGASACTRWASWLHLRCVTACESPIFDFASAILIVVNAVTIGAQADYEARHATSTVPLGYEILEKTFCILFTAELGFRIFAFRGQFLSRTGAFWAFFDVFVVTAQLVEEILLLIWHGTGAANMSFMRLMRILRLVRILRVVRIIRFMDELRNLVVSIMNSMRSLFWTLMLLLLGIYGIGVYFTQLIADYRIVNREIGEADNDFLVTHWGGLLVSMLSLFQAMSGGIDWNDLCAPLMTHISPVQGIVFSGYIAFTVLALTNVVTGVFVEGALKSAKEEEEDIFLQGLYELFSNNDTDNTGQITTDQFRGIFESPDMHSHLANMGVNPFEAASLFALLDDDKSGTIDYNEFVGGCMRLRQAAKAIDIIMVMHEAQEIQRVVCEFIERADANFSKLDEFEGQVIERTNFLPEIQRAQAGLRGLDGRASPGTWASERKIE